LRWRPKTYIKQVRGFRSVRIGVGFAFVLLLASSLVAGCSGQKAEDAQPAQATTVPAKFQAREGILLRVLVITDEYFPVAKAKVTLVGLGVNGTTDDWGDAFFHIAHPGRYAIHVHRTGFYPNQTKVVLPEGESSATLRVWLSDAPRDAHYADYYYFNGLCGPTVFVSGATTDADCTETYLFEKPEARFILGRGLTRGYLELDWTPTTGGASDMRLEVRFPDVGPFADGRDVIVAEGPRPVKIIIPEELLTERHRLNGNTAVVTVGLSQAKPVLMSAQQEFQIDGEFSYFVEAPDVDPES
jgi:hypothetical protein